MYCTKCGTKLPEGSGTCPSCGKEFAEKNFDEAQAVDTKVDSKPHNFDVNSVLKWTALIIGILYAFSTAGALKNLFSYLWKLLLYRKTIYLFRVISNIAAFASCAFLTVVLILFASRRNKDNEEDLFLGVVLASLVRAVAAVIIVILDYVIRIILGSRVFTMYPLKTCFGMIFYAVFAAGILYVILYASGTKLLVGKTEMELLLRLRKLPSFLMEELKQVDSSSFDLKTGQKSSAVPDKKMKTDRSFIFYFLFSILTFGVYGLYVNHKMAKDINQMCKGDGRSTAELLIRIILSLCTFGLYEFYWNYSFAERMNKNAERFNVEIKQKGSTILLIEIIGLFFCGLGPIIAMYFQIRNLNELSKGYNRLTFGEE